MDKIKAELQIDISRIMARFLMTRTRARAMNDIYPIIAETLTRLTSHAPGQSIEYESLTSQMDKTLSFYLPLKSERALALDALYVIFMDALAKLKEVKDE